MDSQTRVLETFAPFSVRYLRLTVPTPTSCFLGYALLHYNSTAVLRRMSTAPQTLNDYLSTFGAVAA